MLPEISDTELRLFDALGRLVSNFPKEKNNAGFHRIPLNINSLSQGVYFLQIKINDEVFTQKIFKH